ncbi:MAG: hypothetical protein QOF78_35, partial [Phycisphaerales bacterium]|nr:hypothetical protein [Phycisphaerales bacterium]
MADLENELHTAWMHVAARLSDDPHDLARRIARRRRAVLVRPPRAWCLALRASDSRLANVATILPAIRDIDDSTTDSQLTLPAGRATRGVTATDTVSSPCHPLTLSPCHPQHVSLTPAALRTLCAPVRLDAPGDTLDAVAKKLGTTPIGLRNARLNNIFRVRHVKGLAGRRGRPVPLLYIDRPLDPAARNFAEPDPAWIWTATYLVGRIPADFAQTLTRVEHYRSHVSRTRYAEHVHPEARDGSAPPRKRRYLPPPEPDPVWYKWSRSGHFLGDDPTNWRKSPQDLGERPPRFLPKPRRGKAQRRPGSSSQGSLHFNGHQWLCPVCGKTCRTIY